MAQSRFDKLLDAFHLFLQRMGPPEESEAPMGEDQLENAMFHALKRAKSYIRPRSFGGN